jgi:hypothetical protein
MSVEYKAHVDAETAISHFEHKQHRAVRMDGTPKREY